MADLKGKDLYFGTTKVDNSVVDAVAKEHGGAATIFVKAGSDYVTRCHDAIKKEDGSSAVGTALDASSPRELTRLRRHIARIRDSYRRLTSEFVTQLQHIDSAVSSAIQEPAEPANSPHATQERADD